MLNFIKSEWYRLSHKKSIWLVAILLLALAFLQLEMLYWIPNRPNLHLVLYHNEFHDAYNTLANQAFWFLVLSAGVTLFLYEESYRARAQLPTLSFGISPLKIILGKWLTASIFSFIASVWVSSVYLLLVPIILKPDSESQVTSLTELIWELPLLIPLIMASVATILFFLEWTQKIILTVLAWVGLWLLIPAILEMFGYQNSLLKVISSWMPLVFLRFGGVDFSNPNQTPIFEFIWNRADGIMKLLSSGFGISLLLIGSTLIFLAPKDSR